MYTFLHIAGGLALLVGGAEILVRYASALALRLRIPALVVGLTVVAFGTSAPELAISTMASVSGQADLAVGNVIGSNIYNVLLILGISALVTPLLISSQLVRIDIPVMIGVSVLALAFAWDGVISHWESVVFLFGLASYTMMQIVQGKRGQTEETGAVSETSRGLAFILVMLIAGLGILIGGSKLFLDGAVGLARIFGVSELVIGLTIVAAGTSLPETATSIVAAVRGQRDIAVGNVVGSNVFNILGVLGVAGIVAPAGIEVAPSTIYLDLPVMVVVAVACLPVFFANHTISRWQGGVFFGYYIAYVFYLILDAQNHDAISFLSLVLLYFALPITAITFSLMAIQHLVRRD